MSEYKSIEQKFEEKILEPAGKAMYNFIRGFYGGVALPFRVPSFVRKTANNQTALLRINKTEGFFDIDGVSTLGSISGLVTDCVFMNCAYDSALNDNYLPAAILLGTNLISGIYELGRLPRSREEYRKLKGKKGEQK